ncbi:hypothetical protein ACGE32_31160, partial [Klebsiella pneumoniae]
NQERLNRAGKHLGVSSRLEAIVADVTRESDVAGLFARVGELDHIVCTAADIRGAYELLPALDLDAARRAVES